MKIFIIIALVLLIIFIMLAASGKKGREKGKENAKCLTIENYLLIRDSPYADELCKYTIRREKDELRFKQEGEGYTLFYLTIEKGETPKVKLVGLDGYGIRDRVFLNYVCRLLKEIKEKESE